MKHDAFTVAGRCQKTFDAPLAAHGLLDQPLCHGTKGHRFDHQFYLPYLASFLNF